MAYLFFLWTANSWDCISIPNIGFGRVFLFLTSPFAAESTYQRHRTATVALGPVQYQNAQTNHFVVRKVPTVLHQISILAFSPSESTNRCTPKKCTPLIPPFPASIFLLHLHYFYGSRINPFPTLCACVSLSSPTDSGNLNHRQATAQVLKCPQCHIISVGQKNVK